MSKDDILAHKEELKNMQKKDAKHGGEPNSLSKHGGDVKSMANTMSGRCALSTLHAESHATYWQVGV